MVAVDPADSWLGAAPGAATTDHYAAFTAEVAGQQLAAWLPAAPARILDLSGATTLFAALMVAAGHEVVHVVPDGCPAAAPAPGLVQVVADRQDLGFLADASVDCVVAEQGALSHCLAAESTVAELARVVRPGGQVLLCVDSLVLGLSQLAEAGRWAELADVPAADVVLVPGSDGTITRAFSPGELRVALQEAGFDTEWVRPRTVLSPEAVRRALTARPQSLPELVETELALAREREGESIGVQLLVSAVRRG